ncbi:MAG: hypothetical protein LBJ18_01000 [Rickettsiales bacterium]|jgi:hypothetical protein|nr:hypothetical protein [Rickettsiales bacterium]
MKWRIAVNKTAVMKLSDLLRLTPYQSYILEQNGEKYNLDRLIKKGVVLYAPYRCTASRGIGDCIAKVFRGPRADLIGSDRILVRDQRGIKLFATGFFSARDGRGKYYADSNGARIEKRIFDRIV